jgi:Fe-S-cluster containining protein
MMEKFPVSGKQESRRQNNFFDTCSQCETSYSCCHETTPPITCERRKTIEAYLKAEKIRVERPFVEENYVFPRLDSEGYCVFQDKKTKKCSVHAVKPETCVAGPVTFDINAKTGKIEWFIKTDKLCQLAGIVYRDEELMQKHFKSAKKEILKLVDQLDSEALKAILQKDEPETFKFDEDSIDRKVLEKLRS